MDRPGPLNEGSARSRLLGEAGPSSHGTVVSLRPPAMEDVYSCAGASIHYVTIGWAAFRRSRDWFVAELLFGSYPVLDILSVFAAALNI